MKNLIFVIYIILLIHLMPPAQANAKEQALATTQSVAPRLFSVPIDVSGLAADSEFVSVSCPIAFDDLLKGLGVRGIVDEHTIRLYAIDGVGAEVEEAVQFSPIPRPRCAGRRCCREHRRPSVTLAKWRRAMRRRDRAWRVNWLGMSAETTGAFGIIGLNSPCRARAGWFRCRFLQEISGPLTPPDAQPFLRNFRSCSFIRNGPSTAS